MTMPEPTDTGGFAVVQRRTVLSMGSNVGERMENLQGAIDALFDAPGLEFVELSPVYETKPVGGPEQHDFLNVVLVADTRLTPATLLERVLNVEDAFRRDRDVRWGPRILDIDIVVIGEVKSEVPELLLPHPRAHERAFVLVPWHDIDPAAELPGRGRVAELLADVEEQSVWRRDDLSLQPPA